MFQKLRKVTSVNDLEKILPHKKDLLDGKKELLKIEKLLNDEIEKTK